MKALLSIRRVFIAVIFLGLVTLAARNVADPDVWWHLKTGEYIAQHHQVPRTDPFSYTREGMPWVAHEWLTDLTLYGVYRMAGWGGLISIFAAIVSMAFIPMFLRCVGTPFVTGILTLFGAWATAPVWGVRPQVLSILLTSLWLWVLERSENRQTLLWWTLPIMLVWVNIHAGFALGIALLGLFLAGEILERKLGQGSDNPSRLRALAAALALNLLVIPLNPYGSRMYFYPIETLRSTAMQTYIAEWASPNFHRLEYFPLLILLLAVVGVLAWSNARIRPREMLLLAVSTIATLSAIRMIPFFVLICVPILTKALLGRNRHLALLREPRRSRPALQFFHAAIVLGMALFAATHLIQVIRRQPLVEAEHFPTAAVDFMAARPSAGPIFNHYDWGGYLIWRLYPRNRVFIDGRADLYGEDLMRQFADAYQLKHNWQQSLDKWGIVRAVIPPSSALATGLRSRSDWTVIYEDAEAVIFSKNQRYTQPTPSNRSNRPN